MSTQTAHVTPDRGLPVQIRSLISVTAVLGAAVLGWHLLAHGAWSADDAIGCGVMAVTTVLAHRLLVTIRFRTETDNFDLTDAVFTAGFVLVPAGPMLAGVAVALIAAQMWRRLAAYKITFNTGQYILGLGLAGLVSKAVGPADSMDYGSWLGAVAGMAVFFLINQASVAFIISRIEHLPFMAVVRPSLSLAALCWAGNVALGLLAVLLWTNDRAGLPLLIVPILLAHLAYRSWLRATQERDQMHRMTSAAAEISLDTDLARRIPATGETPELNTLAGALNRMLERLEAAFQRERRFIREASHELRTPLTVTRGYLEVLGPNPSPEEITEAVDVSLDELDRMGRLVTDLTTLARAEHADFVRSESFALGEFVDKLEAKARPILNGRLIVAPVNRAAVVAADSQRLTQALLNLLVNAAAHGAGEGTVTLKVVDEPDMWRFEVIDKGGGIPVGAEDLIFEPFHREHGAGPGTGLGLAIVRGIAEAHGGRAGVDNRPGDGATFWVHVPRSQRL